MSSDLDADSGLRQRERLWADLLRRFDKRLGAYLRRVHCTDDEAADIVQNTWALAVQHEAQLATAAEPWPILHRALKQSCAAHMRVRRCDSLIEDGALALLLAVDPGDAVADAHRLREWTARALAQLPERQRAAVDFRHRWGWDYWAVAVALGVSESSARVYVKRGLAKLRDLIPTDPPP